MIKRYVAPFKKYLAGSIILNILSAVFNIFSFAIIVPILVAALRHADNLSLALDARCYEEGIHRTHWRVMRARRRDLMVAVACVAYVVALLAVGWL